jgi:hypothetical protein
MQARMVIGAPASTGAGVETGVGAPVDVPPDDEPVSEGGDEPGREEAVPGRLYSAHFQLAGQSLSFAQVVAVGAQ